MGWHDEAPLVPPYQFRRLNKAMALLSHRAIACLTLGDGVPRSRSSDVAVRMSNSLHFLARRRRSSVTVAPEIDNGDGPAESPSRLMFVVTRPRIADSLPRFAHDSPWNFERDSCFFLRIARFVVRCHRVYRTLCAARVARWDGCRHQADPGVQGSGRDEGRVVCGRAEAGVAGGDRTR